MIIENGSGVRRKDMNSGGFSIEETIAPIEEPNGDKLLLKARARRRISNSFRVVAHLEMNYRNSNTRAGAFPPHVNFIW